MMNSLFRRLALFLSILGLTVLAGCVDDVKVDPTRTKVMVTWTVGSGMGGTNTTRTDVCALARQLNAEEVAEIEKEPYLLIDRNLCTNASLIKEAVWGSEPIETAVVKTATAATFGNIASAIATRWLDKQRAQDCKELGGCGTNITNLVVAEGGDSNSSSSSTSTNVNHNTVGVGVGVSVGGGSGGCKTTDCK